MLIIEVSALLGDIYGTVHAGEWVPRVYYFPDMCLTLCR